MDGIAKDVATSMLATTLDGNGGRGRGIEWEKWVMYDDKCQLAVEWNGPP